MSETTPRPIGRRSFVKFLEEEERRWIRTGWCDQSRGRAKN